MTNEDTAWEQFSKADSANIGDASAAGMLQAILAELNSVKADTARLTQKIEGGAGAPPVEGEMPPEAMGMPPVDDQIPPMGGEGASAPEIPEEGGVPPMDMGAAPPAMPPMPEAAEQAMPVPGLFGDEAVAGATGDETLAALQDALVQVGDPKAISKLADIIKEYVEENYPEASEDAIPPVEGAPVDDATADALVDALVGDAAGDVSPEDAELMATDGADVSGEDAALADELLGALTKSDSDEKEESGEDKKENTGDHFEGEGPASQEEGPVQVDDRDTNPAIQINLFLGAKIEDVLGKNKEMGITDDKDLPTESFKVCDNPIKKSIDDMINERMRTKSGIDGKRYQISKSASEMQRDRFTSLQKSIGSFDAVKGMRVGDVLSSMFALKRSGATSIEKSYEPVIDELVKYCDNNVGPMYTSPIFKSFGVDLDTIYEPLDTDAFERAIGLGNTEKTRLQGRANVDKSRMTGKKLTDDQIKRIQDIKANANQYFIRENEIDKQKFPQAVNLARALGLWRGGAPVSTDEMIDILERANIPRKDILSSLKGVDMNNPEEVLETLGPYMFMVRRGLDPVQDAGIIQDVYDKLMKYEPEGYPSDYLDYDTALDERYADVQNANRLRKILSAISKQAGITIPTDLRMVSDSGESLFPESSSYQEHKLAGDLIRAKKFLSDPNAQPFTIGRKTYDPRKIMETQRIPEFIEGENFNLPGNVFPGAFASWYSPALKLGDKFYPMGARGIPYLEKYLSKLDPQLLTPGSIPATALAEWKAALEGGTYEEKDAKKKAFVDSLKNTNRYPQQIADIFGSNGEGYSSAIFADNPVGELLEMKGKSIGLRPEFAKMVDDWADSTTMSDFDENASIDDLISEAEGYIRPTADQYAAAGIDPRGKEAGLIGGENSMATSNKGRAYMPGKYKLTSVLNTPERVRAFADYDDSSIENATDRDTRRDAYNEMIQSIKDTGKKAN